MRISSPQSRLAKRLAAEEAEDAIEKSGLPKADPDTPWDGADARKKMLAAVGGKLDTPTAQKAYARGFMSVDGDPSNLGSYKLPFATIIDGKLTAVPKGEAAARGALKGARGGVQLPDSERSAAEKQAGVKKTLEERLEAVEAGLAKMRTLAASDPEGASEDEVPADIAFTKSDEEQRYTFGPLYTPMEKDAHDEFATAPTLQKALWSFARAGDRRIRKQHDTDNVIGEVVEQVVWPYPVEVELTIPGGGVRKACLPANTAFMGVVWSEEAWPLVKSGAISGYSMGGRAVRVRTEDILAPMNKSEGDLSSQ